MKRTLAFLTARAAGMVSAYVRDIDPALSARLKQKADKCIYSQSIHAQGRMASGTTAFRAMSATRMPSLKAASIWSRFISPSRAWRRWKSRTARTSRPPAGLCGAG